MKVYDITLTCDHKMLVAAPTAAIAKALAAAEARTHGAMPIEEAVEIDLSKAGLLAWYPGPWSADAITDGGDLVVAYVAD